jgi:hypothetical protein
MRRYFSLLVASVCCAGLTAQDFECYPPGILPNAALCGSCEGVVANSLTGFSFNPFGVQNAAACGFPTSGLNYAVLVCNGPAFVAPGGPAIWPVPANVQEVRVPIPAGSTVVSFDWEYFNREGFGSSFNDGMAVGIVTSTGALWSQLVYADNQIAFGTCSNSNFGSEIMPPGPQSFVGVLPLLTGCEYLSIQAWNFGDNLVSGDAYVDNIAFNGVGAPCSPPGFPPGGPGFPVMLMGSPFGPGSLQVNVTGLAVGGSYFLAATANAGTFPAGWFYGIDIGFAELATQLLAGYPFSGPLSAPGPCSVGGDVALGPFFGVPSGLVVFAVAVGVPGPVLAPPVTGATQPIFYMVP